MGTGKLLSVRRVTRDSRLLPRIVGI